ncbi:hypothetical protein HAP47_0001510 [Bradyrhizobium sp. 41S5]|uniref:hypothetical protein n=1 Tax=Bradyrhizobium sp. 41S5 TaxID=1404443 RepID=UPI00156B2BF3|nr:hypothetical protein [Bradyrhizobium sp. 41S5]UFX45437.1 hypothetical protein HAP47_0001510 [Bradyrhizobium sp. 41S5]
MARVIYADKLRNRTNRLRLPIRKKVYKQKVAPSVAVCYRRCAGAGSWSVQTDRWLKRFALADDHEQANGSSVMDYLQAVQQALKLARGTEGGTDKPVTVSQAINAYETDLAVRGGAKHNAVMVRNHCDAALLAKPVMLLAEAELRDWYRAMLAAGKKPSTASRIVRSTKAMLTLASKRDARITNAAAWKHGLKLVKPKGSSLPPRDHYHLSDATLLNIVHECYRDDPDFGALVEVLVGTGARQSQVEKLRPRDLLDDGDDASKPSVMMWCSLKGRDREPEQRRLAVSLKLARMLRARAIARGPNRLLFDRIWDLSARFRAVLQRLGLDPTLTPYVARHASIIRQIRNGKPLRSIAFAHDTSTKEIERTYGRYLNVASEDLRSGLLDDSAAVHGVDNVIPMVR